MQGVNTDHEVETCGTKVFVVKWAIQIQQRKPHKPLAAIKLSGALDEHRTKICKPILPNLTLPKERQNPRQDGANPSTDFEHPKAFGTWKQVQHWTNQISVS